MRWIISLLDFRLWNGAGQGGGGAGQGGGGAGQGGGGAGAGAGGAGSGGPDQGGGGEGGYGSHRSDRRPGSGWFQTETRQYAAPAPEAPPEEPGPKTEATYARHLEDVRQRNRGAAQMPAYAQDYEIPDTAFGSRIY